jgi:hypothetical protein
LPLVIGARTASLASCAEELLRFMKLSLIRARPWLVGVSTMKVSVVAIVLLCGTRREDWGSDDTGDPTPQLGLGVESYVICAGGAIDASSGAKLISKPTLAYQSEDLVIKVVVSPKAVQTTYSV